MAGNIDTIETLALNINVSYKGKKNLDDFSQSLQNLQPRLENLPENISVTVNAVNAVANAAKQAAKSMESFKTSFPDTTTFVRLPNAHDLFGDLATKTADVISKLKDKLSILGGKLSSVGAKIGLVAAGLKGKLSESAKKAGNSIGEFVKSIGRIAMYRAIRSLLKAITEGFTTGIQNMAKFSSEFNDAMSKISTSSLYFKNAIGTMVAPLIEEFAPVIEQIVDIIVNFINKINEAYAVMNGKDSWTRAKKKVVDYADSVEKAKSSLMGFDEINKLSGDDSSDASDMFSVEEVSTDDSSITQVQDFVDRLEKIIGGALLAIGVLLCATGHLALGIGCIIAGATITAASINWDAFGTTLQDTLEGILTLTGIALVAIGLILALTGASLPIGIAMMVAGGALLGYSATVNWDLLKTDFEDALGMIMSLIGTALLAVGFILAFTGHIPLGIALIAAGAVVLGTGQAVSWNGITDDITDALATLAEIISGAALVVGAVLALSGLNIPLGIALIAVGAVGLVATETLNDNPLGQFLTDHIDTIADVLKAAGAFMIVAGLALAFTGIALPLGIALIAAGVMSFMGASAMDNGQTFLEWIDGIIQKAKNKVIDAINFVIGVINKIPGVDIDLIPKTTTPSYATGGFPEDGLFYANHNELVGSFSNGKTAVANNQQITDGIAQASYEGMARALAENSSGGNYTFVAQLNGKTIFEEVVKQNTKDIRSFGVNRLVNV